MRSALRSALRSSPRWYSTSEIAGSSDDALKALLEAPDFLEAVDASDGLTAAFRERVAAAPMEVSRLGDPESEGGGPLVYAYSVHLFGSDAPAFLGTARAALWKAEGNAMLFGATPRGACVPLDAMATLARTAANEMREFGADKVAAVARLRGLNAFLVETEAWEAYDEPSRGAIEAIALGRPRPGHSVLGQGTFRDAEKDFTTLALGFAGRAETGEAAVYREAGAHLAGINWLHDTSPEAMADSGGCTAAFHFEAPDDSEG